MQSSATTRPLRYLIAAPDGVLVDWQVRCIGHLADVGARAVGLIATDRAPYGARSTFWSIATMLARPGSLQKHRAASATPYLPPLTSADTLGQDAIDFVLDFGSGSTAAAR